jgi:Mo-dependent nitrogenase C-terminus
LPVFPFRLAAKIMNTSSPSFDHHASEISLLELLKQWLDQLEIHDRHMAQRIVKLIPAQCPFERHITCFGRSIVHIPPLCKLNPVYDQLAGLRFRALCCLAEEWGEDISAYC